MWCSVRGIVDMHPWSYTLEHWKKWKCGLLMMVPSDLTGSTASELKALKVGTI